MYRDHTVGVVVPAYNEAAFVGDVIRELPAFVDAVYLVDDASTDGTWRAAGKVRERETVALTDGVLVRADRVDFERRLAGRVAETDSAGRVTRLRHDENRGAGGAVKTGYLAALEDGVDVVATIDGDGQMDAGRLRDLLDPIVDERAGYAKGNRFAGTDVFREMPPFRLFGNLLLTGLTRVASGYWGLSDPQNGFTAVSRQALLSVDLEAMTEYYGYMNHLMAMLNVAGVRIADVPVPVTYGDEESHIDYFEYIRRVSGLLLRSFRRRVWHKYGRGQYPTFGYLGGVVFAVLSALIWLFSAARGDVKQGRVRAAEGTLVASVAVGVAFLVDWTSEPSVVTVRPSPRRPDHDRGEVDDDEQ